MFIILNMLGRYKTVKAIQELVSRPGKAFSVRGLAGSAGISVGASQTALAYMKEKGIATKGSVGRSHQYRANLESALCRQWKILFNLNMVEEAGLLKELAERVPGMQSVLLYGSFGRGTNDEKSDVDLLVVALKASKPGFSPKLGREANISIFSQGQWREKAKKDKVFYENIIYDSVVLFGERPVVL